MQWLQFQVCGNMKCCLALALCVAGLTAWMATTGKHKTLCSAAYCRDEGLKIMFHTVFCFVLFLYDLTYIKLRSTRQLYNNIYSFM